MWNIVRGIMNKQYLKSKLKLERTNMEWIKFKMWMEPAEKKNKKYQEQLREGEKLRGKGNL